MPKIEDNPRMAVVTHVYTDGVELKFHNVKPVEWDALPYFAERVHETEWKSHKVSGLKVTWFKGH